MRTAGKFAIALMLAAQVPAGALAVELFDPDDQHWAFMPALQTRMNAYQAGVDADGPVAICRVRHRLDVDIGHLGAGFCMIGGDGMNRRYSEFEVLVGVDEARWVVPEGTLLPVLAMNLNGTVGPAAVACRVHYEGADVLGMVREGRCSAGYGVGELISDEFEVLVGAGADG